MKPSTTRLRGLLALRRHGAALALLGQLIDQNPRAAQLYLLKGILLQVNKDAAPNSLQEAQKAFMRALRLDPTYFEALVELMHFYDAVVPDVRKAQYYARRVRRCAEKALRDSTRILA